MIEVLVSTNPDWVLTIARLVIGVIFFAHGAQKVLGWYGGAGFSATLRILTVQLKLPAPIAVLVISAEFFGGLGLIVGLLSRIAALGILLAMLGAIAMVHFRYGLFMDWFGNQKGHGIEYHLLVIALAFVVIVKGAGAFSIDHVWYQHRNAQASAVQELQGNDYDPD
jgi:putative oxidoreductase